MKNTCLLFVLLFASLIIHAQQFEMPIYFEDAIGNVDSVIIGYDSDATNGIDEQFGEVNTLGVPFEKEFEVRAGFYDWYKIYFESNDDIRTLESKKFIVGKVCEDPGYHPEANSIMVSIKCNHWPITVSWDRSLFQDECSHLDLINCIPGGWFDACGGNCPSFAEMTEQDQAEVSCTTYTIITGSDTLQTLYFPFETLLDVGVRDEKLKNDVYVFPNPSADRLQFKYDVNLFNNAVVVIYDAIGIRKGTYIINEPIDVSTWNNGVYFYEIFHSDSVIRVGKFMINQHR